MARFRWKAIDQYSSWVATLVRFMWQHTPAPMQPAEFAETAGIPRQMLARWLAAGPDTELAPDPTAVRGAARAMGIPTSEFMALVGYGSAADPFLDRDEAITWVQSALDHGGDALADATDRAIVARVLDALRDAARDATPVAAAATRVSEGDACLNEETSPTSAAAAQGTSGSDTRHLDGQSGEGN